MKVEGLDLLGSPGQSLHPTQASDITIVFAGFASLRPAMSVRQVSLLALRAGAGDRSGTTTADVAARSGLLTVAESELRYSSRSPSTVPAYRPDESYSLPPLRRRRCRCASGPDRQTPEEDARSSCGDSLS